MIRNETEESQRVVHDNPCSRVWICNGKLSEGWRAEEWHNLTLWITDLLCGSQQTGKFFKRWVYQTTLLPSKNAGQEEAPVRTGHGTTD